MGTGRRTGVTDATRWYKPKLIEVAIPLEDINKESAREKSIRHGHPSTLHLWWARRPLAACRAVLFAQLVDDPSAKPDQFPTEELQKAERERLHGIIKRLVVWENIHDEGLLKEARTEIWKSCDGNPPPILDPFAGGGSIPLEAQRLGLEAHASDLNPVAVLINKALIEIPPIWAGCPPVFPGAADGANSWPGATGLAEDVRRYGQRMRDEAEKRIGHLYPAAKLSDGTEATVIAWIWARTVTCPNPACRAITPLISTYWLAKNKDRPTWLKPVVEKNSVSFEIRIGAPGPEDPPKRGRGASFVCLLCGSAIGANEIHRQLDDHIAPSPMLLATVAEGNRQRVYLPASEAQIAAAHACDGPARDFLEEEYIVTAPARGTFGGNAQGRRYGFKTFADYFSSRQLITLVTFSDLISEAPERIAYDALATGISEDDASAYGKAVATYLAFALSKMADRGSTVCSWVLQRESVRNTFARQAIPMAWDYVEMNMLREGAGSFDGAVEWTAESFDHLPVTITAGMARQADAAHLHSPVSVPVAIATDPPYYDNIGYADLADFFYVWLRRSIGSSYPDLTSTMLTPKTAELVANPYRFGGDAEQAEKHFENGFIQTFRQIREANLCDAPIIVFYAFKQAEAKGVDGISSTGWETMLTGLMDAGFGITATWPMRTERPDRSVGIETNSLASSIVLACRPRSETAGVTDRRGLIAALREELPDALRKLQQGSIAPVDLPQAAIGPGMAVFSRYARVNEPDGSAMKVRPALGLINQVLDEVLSQQEGGFGSDTRWCVDWFKSYGFDEGSFGAAETLSKAKNTSIAGLEHAGVLRSRGGKVRLLSVQDIPEDYDPARDDRVSEWEIVLHLAKRLTEQGGESAARLMAAARAAVDLDAVRELAYLLFSIAEKRGWTETALLFNGLGTSWSDLAAAAKDPALASPPPVQGQLSYETE
jgi:putative DNA methylase